MLTAVQWGPFVQGDIRDKELLRQVFAQYQPEAVIHFAALAYVGESVQHPEKYYTNNVAGTLALLEVMRQTASNLFFPAPAPPMAILNPYLLTKSTRSNR